MHRYRTHTCGAFRLEHAGQLARLSGWVHRKRDHGNLLFIDLRDNYGITQCVVDVEGSMFETAEALSLETVICVTGTVVKRSDETINPDLPTGEVELQLEGLEVLSVAASLPMPVRITAKTFAP